METVPVNDLVALPRGRLIRLLVVTLAVLVELPEGRDKDFALATLGNVSTALARAGQDDLKSSDTIGTE